MDALSPITANGLDQVQGSGGLLPVQGSHWTPFRQPIISHQPPLSALFVLLHTLEKCEPCIGFHAQLRMGLALGRFLCAGPAGNAVDPTEPRPGYTSPPTHRPSSVHILPQSSHLATLQLHAAGLPVSSRAGTQPCHLSTKLQPWGGGSAAAGAGPSPTDTSAEGPMDSVCTLSPAASKPKKITLVFSEARTL